MELPYFVLELLRSQYKILDQSLCKTPSVEF